jgi:hypothetical protein
MPATADGSLPEQVDRYAEAVRGKIGVLNPAGARRGRFRPRVEDTAEVTPPLAEDRYTERVRGVDAAYLQPLPRRPGQRVVRASRRPSFCPAIVRRCAAEDQVADRRRIHVPFRKGRFDASQNDLGGLRRGYPSARRIEDPNFMSRERFLEGGWPYGDHTMQLVPGG